MDLCLLTRADLAKNFQRYTRRRVKDEFRYRDAFAQQGASASQKTAAKFLDTISKNRGMAGGASDAVSASTQVKMIDAPRFLQLPEEARPEIWIRIPPR